ncbi:uncharacterized protein LOC108908986 [Anoplophora glabripennis]|uniref:uncharacterized protein LOC108908986 n=1 Tax=Anoplophora glabripennis TaxID=217634 RepID=UPI000873E8D2|nr:uncharacterized protein LOC108908986 [Anoplophora glabripennis]
MRTILVVYLFSAVTSTLSQENTKCRDRNRPVSTEKADLYTVIDATLNQKLILQCHYCNENDDSEPRNWYKIDKLGLTQPHEVSLSMENEMELNRVLVNLEHSLIIKNFSETDTGLYYCLGLEHTNQDEKYNYLVDLLVDNVNVTEIETGNLTAWAKYHDDYFSSINALFKESHGVEFLRVREYLKLDLEIVTQWDQWGICQVCGRPKDEGIRKKKGYCRIKLTKNGQGNSTENPDEIYLQNANAISCRSKRLLAIFPEISNLTVVIPDFILDERCEGICNPDAEGTNAGWKKGKIKGFKYRKIFVLAENSHVTLTCPESTLENEVVWRKRGKVLKPGDLSNPHVILNTFSSLYLMDVTPEEAGNYTCEVDDIKMQQVRVYVTPKSRLLTQEFTRHLTYLGFILSLTTTCYCAGLIITCHRRKTFKTYEDLIKEHPEETDEFASLL